MKAGAIADLVVFDYDKIIDKATYNDPHQFPEGIRHVIVNGEFMVRDGKETRKLPGKVLRPVGKVESPSMHGCCRTHLFEVSSTHSQ